MGTPFHFASKPSPSLQNSRATLHSSATDSNSHSSSGSPNRPPSLTDSPVVTHYKNILRLTWIITPGNEFGFLLLECFIGVEVVRVKRKVLWTSNQGAVEQEPSNENEEELEAILGSDTESGSERGYMTEHVEVTERET